ncbi:MAG: DUF2130 domain-containing protein [Candidatus Aenigmarchaeota archaeon]|nr:DUF2130 domain-containing protein [Candidatus Aenigmarchaeota archaeon]
MKQEITNFEGLLCNECASRLSEVFGMTKAQIQNGGMKEIVWKLQLAEITMKEAGVQFDQKLLVSEAITAVNEAWVDKRLQEQDNRYYEELDKKDDKINELKIQIEKIKLETIKQTENELKKEYAEKLKHHDEIKHKLLKRENQIENLTKELEAYKSKEKLQPVKMGDKLEDIVADALKRAFPMDDIIPERKGKNEVDIKETVRDGKKILGKILVECKNTQKWNNNWIKTVLAHGKRENTEFLVIVTNAIPNEKFISPLGLEKEGVLITTPDKSTWVVAFIRQAIVRTSEAINKLENERERLSRQAEVRQKLLKMIKSDDFKAVFSACENIQQDVQEIRNRISKVKVEIDNSTISIEQLVKTITNTNTKFSEAFERLIV